MMLRTRGFKRGLREKWRFQRSVALLQQADITAWKIWLYEAKSGFARHR
jgi:hypothetical protein